MYWSNNLDVYNLMIFFIHDITVKNLFKKSKAFLS